MLLFANNVTRPVMYAATQVCDLTHVESMEAVDDFVDVLATD
jgi:hypothetical protein